MIFCPGGELLEFCEKPRRACHQQRLCPIVRLILQCQNIPERFSLLVRKQVAQNLPAGGAVRWHDPAD